MFNPLQFQYKIAFILWLILLYIGWKADQKDKIINDLNSQIKNLTINEEKYNFLSEEFHSKTNGLLLFIGFLLLYIAISEKISYDRRKNICELFELMRRNRQKLKIIDPKIFEFINTKSFEFAHVKLNNYNILENIINENKLDQLFLYDKFNAKMLKDKFSYIARNADKDITKHIIDNIDNGNYLETFIKKIINDQDMDITCYLVERAVSLDAEKVVQIARIVCSSGTLKVIEHIIPRLNHTKLIKIDLITAIQSNYNIRDNGIKNINCLKNIKSV